MNGKRRNFRTEKPPTDQSVKFFYDTDEECEGEYMDTPGGECVAVSPAIETRDSWVYFEPQEIKEWDDIGGGDARSSLRCCFWLEA